MMKIQFTSLFIFLIILQSNAQQFHWGMAIDHQGFGASPSHTLADYDNNLLTFGSFAALGPRIDLDPDPIDSFIVNSFQHEGYIAKYASVDGSLMWATGVGGGVNADLSIDLLELDKSSNHLFAGNLLGTVDFDFGPGVINETSSSNISSTVLIQYDSTFAYVRHLKFEGPTNQSRITIDKIESDFQNNYYLLGSYFDTVDFDPGPNQSIYICDSGRSEVYMAKYDQQFNLVWVDTFSSRAQMGPGFAIDFINFEPVSGNIILCGDYNGNDTIDLDPGTGQALLYNGYDECSFTAFYDTAGNFIRMWKSFSKYNNDIDGIATDNSGSLYHLVNFEDTLYLQNPFAPPYLISQFPDVGYGMVKYDVNGNYISSTILYSTVDINFNHIDVKDGNVYSSGTIYNGSIDLDPSASTHLISASINSYFLVCYKTTLGNNSFVWGFSDPDSNSDSDDEQFCISADHTLYVSGTFQDSLDCDPSSSTYYLHAPAMGYMFHIAYDSTTTTSIADIFELKKNFVYPNPAQDFIKINMPDQQEIEASIFSIQGKALMSIKNLHHEEKINIEALSPGIYLLNLNSNSDRQILKFIKTD